jgi:surfactin synthase thioesterase subunit
MTATSHDRRERWLSSPSPRPTADVRLFCLPYAGAGASVFHAWPAAFGPRVEVVTVHLPGRESRFREPPEIDPVRVADAIAVAADRPYAIFGHSMGARIGFDVVRELRRRGRPLPERLYVSGARPPDAPQDGPFDGLSRAADHELIDRLSEAGGIPDAVRAVPELVELFLPTLRADLAWLDRYEFVEEAPLPVPLVVFAGTHDQVAREDQMAGWHRLSEADATVHTLPGGHFFLADQLPAIARVIESDLVA